MDKPMGCNEAAKLGRALARRRRRRALHRVLQVHLPERARPEGHADRASTARNGAAYNVAPHVFHELGADVVAIGVKPDGFNINEQDGATSPAAGARATKADLGIALDGDADRVLIVDGDGRALRRRRAALRHRAAPRGKDKVERRRRHADDQSRLRAGDAQARHRLRAAPRSATATCSSCCARRAGSSAARTPGHIICLDKHTTGDGIVSALQVLHAMRESAALAEAAHRRPASCIRRCSST